MKEQFWTFLFPSHLKFQPWLFSFASVAPMTSILKSAKLESSNVEEVYAEDHMFLWNYSTLATVTKEGCLNGGHCDMYLDPNNITLRVWVDTNGIKLFEQNSWDV